MKAKDASPDEVRPLDFVSKLSHNRLRATARVLQSLLVFARLDGREALEQGCLQLLSDARAADGKIDRLPDSEECRACGSAYRRMRADPGVSSLLDAVRDSKPVEELLEGLGATPVAFRAGADDRAE